MYNISFQNIIIRGQAFNDDITVFSGSPSLLHRKKKVREFPVPSRDVTTKLSLGGNNDVITELFLPRGSLVSDIPAGDGKLVNIFYGIFSSPLGLLLYLNYFTAFSPQLPKVLFIFCIRCKYKQIIYKYIGPICLAGRLVYS